MEIQVRLSIPTCVGCGAMREFASCEGICRERKLELVRGGDYDELVVVAEARRLRIEVLLQPVEQLGAANPRRADPKQLYESFRQKARLALREAAAPIGEQPGDAALDAEPEVVWRCPDCGGLESPQPCIGVCIWRPVDWVQADVFEAERAQALREIELERSLRGFLGRLARVTPRDGEWERNWRAFQVEARGLIVLSGSQSSCAHL